MKGSFAVLASCLHVLALVDAMSITKLSLTKYDMGWEEMHSNFLPVADVPDFVKYSPWYNPVLYGHEEHNAERFAIPHPAYNSPSNMIDQRPGSTLFNYAINSPQYGVSKNNVDDWQRNTDPRMKLKLKLKIDLPLNRETTISQPKYEESHPFQLTFDSPQIGDTTLVDPSIQSNEQINSISKTLPEHVKEKSEREKHQHTEFEDEPSLSTTQHYAAETAQLDAYLEYLNSLQNIYNKLREIGELTNDTSNEFVSEIDKGNSDVALYDRIHNVSRDPSSVSEISGRPDEAVSKPSTQNVRTINGENEDLKMMQLQVKPDAKDLASVDPHVDLYDHIHRISKTPQHTLDKTQQFPTHDSSNEHSTQQLLVKPDGKDLEGEAVDPHVDLYDHIHRVSKTPQHTFDKTQQFPTHDSTQQLQVKPDAKDLEGESVDPHVDLYEHIHRMSKTPQHTLDKTQQFPTHESDSEEKLKTSGDDTVIELFKQNEPTVTREHEKHVQIAVPLSENIEHDQMKLSDSKVMEDNTADPHVKLYDHIHAISKASQHTPEKAQQSDSEGKQEDIELIPNKDESSITENTSDISNPQETLEDDEDTIEEVIDHKVYGPFHRVVRKDLDQHYGSMHVGQQEESPLVSIPVDTNVTENENETDDLKPKDFITRIMNYWFA